MTASLVRKIPALRDDVLTISAAVIHGDLRGAVETDTNGMRLTLVDKNDKPLLDFFFTRVQLKRAFADVIAR